MARPLKNGLDYFPLDTGMDEKFELLEAKHGIVGFGVIIKLYQKVYREHGYFYPWGEDEKILFCRWVNVEIAKVDAIIADAIKYGIFDAGMAEKNILTSTGIQKRFIEASKRRLQLSLFKDLLLVNVNIIPVNVGKMSRNVDMVRFFVRNNTQSKLNKSKVNKSITGDDGDNVDINPKKDPPPAEASPPEKVDPLYHKIRTAFETVLGRLPDYAREGTAIKRIIKFTEGDEAKVAKMIKTFYNLTKSQDRYWSGQPFLPSVLSSGGIWPRVMLEADKSDQLENVDWYDRYAKEAKKEAV